MWTGFVPSLDLVKHLFNIAHRKFILGGTPDSLQLFLHASYRLLSARRIESLPDPFGNRHMARPRRALNFSIFCILEKNAQSLTHVNESK